MLSLLLNNNTDDEVRGRGESELAVDIVHRNQYKDNYVSSPASIEQMAVMPTFYVLDQSMKKKYLAHLFWSRYYRSITPHKSHTP